MDLPVVINKDKVLGLIDEIKPDKVGIFSFAIQNDNDKAVYFDIIHPDIVKELNLSLSKNTVYTIDDIMRVVLKNKNGYKIDRNEFGLLYGKELAFIEFSKQIMKSGEIILIDSSIQSGKLEYESGLTIRFISL